MDRTVNKVPIIGFVRYSQKIKFSGREKERNVFEPEYFEYRFNIFKNITLKSFQQQTNKNFLLLLLHSENMPSEYKERFLKLEENNSFLYNVFVQDTWESFNNAISDSKQYALYENGAAITFRIDNDDAVQTDFIEKLSGYLKLDFVGYAITQPMLYRVKRTEKKTYLIEEMYFPANAIGLAFVTGSPNYKTIMEMGEHDLINERNKMIVLPKFSNGGLMTINGENEINTLNLAKAIRLNESGVKSYMKDHKMGNVNLESLRIFQEKQKHSQVLYKKVLESLIPPIFKELYKKLNR